MKNLFSTKYGALTVMMLCFFTMGFVDLVGIATNYVQEELSLSNSLGGLLVSLTFVWFLVLSIPTGLLMNRIGRKRTVLLAIGVTAFALLLPILTLIPAAAPASFAVYIASFCLLGMGNALMQTSLNPMAANVVAPEHFSATLALGQFVKALASFGAPMIAMWGAMQLGIGWKVVYPLFCTIAIIAICLLWATPIRETLQDNSNKRVWPEMKAAFALLSNPYILLCFFGVMCTAGIDICTNSTAPKLFTERLGMPLAEAGFATSFYFIFRTIGCLSGSAVLSKFDDKKIFIGCICMILTGMLLMAFSDAQWLIYTALALVGIGNANTCIIIFARVIRYDAQHENELAGLMVTGLSGAMIFPLLMGFCSDLFASWGMLPTQGAVFIMAVATVYLLVFSRKL